MGVFLVSDTAINLALTALVEGPYASEIFACEVPFDLATPEWQRELAEAMFRLNVDAMNGLRTSKITF